MFEKIGKGFGANIVNYYKYMRANDIFACYTVLPPQGARKPELYEREGMTVPTLRVTDEDDSGVTLNGMKMLGTSAVFSNETWVGNLLPLGPNQEKESITCAVPLNEEGVSIWSRKPLEKYAVTEFDNPLSWRFDESDAMVIFEDVKVPWEKVFVNNNTEMSRGIYVQSPSHSMGNHQSNIRFHEKLKLIIDINIIKPIYGLLISKFSTKYLLPLLPISNNSSEFIFVILRKLFVKLSLEKLKIIPAFFFSKIFQGVSVVVKTGIP